MTRPRSSRGASTASRVPTTISTSPARIRRHSSARSPSPRPEWSTADPRLEIRPEPIDERHRQGDLRDEHERWSTELERGRDRLDVDRCLSAAGHAIEEQRGRITSGDGVVGEGDRGGLFLRQGSAGRPSPAQPNGPARERQSRPLPNVDLDQAAPREAGDGSVAVALGRTGAGDPARFGIGRRPELQECRRLAWPQPATRRLFTAGERSRRLAALCREPEPALEARAGASDR